MRVLKKLWNQYIKNMVHNRCTPVVAASGVRPPYRTDRMNHQTEVGEGTQLLPCLNSNISIEIPPNTTLNPIETGSSSAFRDVQKNGAQDAKNEALEKARNLTTQHRKSAYVLQASVEKLAEEHNLENLGFLTLTFAQHITDPKEAQRRFNSLITNVIKPRYREYLGVMERQRSGRIHYHLLVVLGYDIRSGFDWDQVSRQNYSSAGPELRKEWSFWRKNAKAYGFGRTELLPIKSTIEAMAKYVGKYIGKHIEARKAEDKGVRLVRYSRGARAGTTRFQFHSEGSSEWRRKVAIFAEIVKSHNPDENITEIADLSRVLGKRWAYRHRETILSLP